MQKMQERDIFIKEHICFKLLSKQEKAFQIDFSWLHVYSNWNLFFFVLWFLQPIFKAKL